jgi:preprotein translocase subunit SecA
VKYFLGLDLPIADWAAEEGVGHEDIEKRIVEAADARAAERLAMVGEEQMRGLEKNFLLQMIDMQWREHLMHLDHLRQVIGLRGYGQRDPLNEYKTEAFSLFEKLLTELRQNTTRWVMTVEFYFQEPEPLDQLPPDGLTEIHLDPTTGENTLEYGNRGYAGANLTPAQREALPVSSLPGDWAQTSRNAPCPCGSGKKFKHCHGALV